MAQVALTHTLTPGTNENVSHVQTNLEDLRDHINTAQLADDNFASSAGMYSAYRVLDSATTVVTDTTAAADYFFVSDNAAIAETTDQTGGAKIMYIAAADYAITGRTTKLRVRAQAFINSVAPARTVTVGLYPVSSVTGGADLFQATLGAAVAGSTVAFASPGANSMNFNTSGDFTIPADGFYVLGFNLAGGVITANSRFAINCWLQQRWT